jgi:hypothetical protein
LCRGTINNVNVILKFRLVSRGSEEFTRKEASHALTVSINKALDGKFPILYCIFKVVTRSPRGELMVWECIATEPLSELTEIDRRDVEIQKRCIKLLGHLHGCGYIHGDPHMGNFMKKGISTVYMIDQDEIRRLPDNEPALSSFMQILDFQTFLFWNNPNFPALNYISSQEGYAIIGIVIHNVWLGLGYHNVVFSPYYHADFQGVSLDIMRAKLSSPYATMAEIWGDGVVHPPTTYLQFLGRPHVRQAGYVESRFMDLVQDNTRLQEVSNMILDAWQRIGGGRRGHGR